MKKRSSRRLSLGIAVAIISVSLGAQDGERLTVSLADSNRQATVRVSSRGEIVVRGEVRKDVLVTTRGHAEEQEPDSPVGGLRRIPIDPPLFVVQDGNEVSISQRKPNAMTPTEAAASRPARTTPVPVGGRAIDIEIRSPLKTNLVLNSVGGDIVVEHIEGEIEATHENGDIRMADVAGTVIANVTNGHLLIGLVRVALGKPMAFTAFNGNIDVTLPSTVKANLKIRTDNGSVFTDFDWQRQPAVPSLLQSQQPRTTVIGELISAAINGGGPDVEIRVFNGNVYLRKGNR